uniref:Bm13395 n=1 Tax=Brugia malayi TaxID=6279 RepID=A0A1I9G6W9_BRUMA|nr:Bm13395 [Brugia malayi]
MKKLSHYLLNLYRSPRQEVLITVALSSDTSLTRSVV